MHAALSDRGANMAGLGVSQCAPLGGRSNILTRRPGIIKPNFGATVLRRNHPLARGLVGCWLFNEGTGTTAHDASGNGNDGVLTNMADPATSTSGWNAGPDGGTLAFDGSNNYVNVLDSPQLRMVGSQLTLSIWCKPVSLHNYGNLIIKGASRGYGIITFANGDWHWQVLGPADVEAGAGSLVNGVTSHIAVTYSPTNVGLYTNGKGSNSVTSGSIGSDSSNFTIGSDIPDGRYWNGLISSVALYNRALTADEIEYLYAFPYCMFR